MIFDGKKAAEAVLEEVKPHTNGLSLGIVMAGHDPVIESFVRIKEKAAARLGVMLVREALPEDAATSDALAAVERLTHADGIIVQLPLSAQIDTEAVLRAIPQEKDIDAVNPDISDDERVVAAPVARAVEEILKESGVEIEDKKAVVIGAGRLVGKPVAHMLARLGAQVTVITQKDGSLDSLKDADIIVSGAGSPGLIQPEHIQEGAILIDAGTSESGGKMTGDAAPACTDKCSLFTPVPGGVGPLAVAMIFKNLLELSQKKNPR